MINNKYSKTVNICHFINFLLLVLWVVLTISILQFGFVLMSLISLGTYSSRAFKSVLGLL